MVVSIAERMFGQRHNKHRPQQGHTVPASCFSSNMRGLAADPPTPTRRRYRSKPVLEKLVSNQLDRCGTSVLAWDGRDEVHKRIQSTNQ